ncbi:MAG: carbamoyl phosphate synthase small subunit, partial [Acutalibacteraceae bacterium]
IEADTESKKSYVKAYVVREWCEEPSNFRCGGTIDEYLKDENIIGVCGVDTREITQIIREHGVMNAKIVDEVTDGLADEISKYKIVDALEAVSCKEPEVHPAVGEGKYNVVLLDYGEKMNIVRELAARGCKVTSVPYNMPAEDILAMNPDGVMLSNGPGDPADNVYSVEQIKKLVGKVPLFGICLGHQMLALANGGKTIKLKYGHRGANQPVKNLATGKTYITSQNHGYAVVADSLDSSKATQSFINANDGTCEGMNYPGLNAFSVQFHPEACAGPMDTEFLFDKFINMMGGKNNAAE